MLTLFNIAIFIYISLCLGCAFNAYEKSQQTSPQPAKATSVTVAVMAAIFGPPLLLSAAFKKLAAALD